MARPDEHGETAADALADAWASGRPVWVRGGPRSGKSTLLTDHAARWAASNGGPVVRVDLADARGAESLAERLATGLSAEATTSTQEWMGWLDRGPGAAERPALDRLSGERFGLPLAEARRRFGPEPLVDLLAAYVEANALPRPALHSAAEQLAGVYDRLEHGARPSVLVLLDNLDGAVCGDIELVLDALLVELPRDYGQDWRVLAAAVTPPPGRHAAAFAQVTLPDVPCPPRAALPGRVAPEALELVCRLVAGHPAPQTLAVAALREVADDGVVYAAADLAASPTLAAWLGRLTPTSPAVLLSALRGGAVPAAERVGYALWEAVSERAAGVTWAELLALRADRLRDAARALTGSPVLVWEQLGYRGEVLAARRPDRTWAGPLPADCAFRLVLLDSPACLPASWPGDARTVVVVPGLPATDERAGLRVALALGQVAEQHPEPAVRAAARGRLARLELPPPAAAWLAGHAVARPGVPDQWREPLVDAPVQLWPGHLFRPRLAALHTRRGEWLDPERLDSPLLPEQAGALWPLVATDSVPDAAPAATQLAALRLAGGPPPAFTEWRARLARLGGELSIPALLAEFSAPPWGLTPELIKLYLVAFARHAPARVEVEVSDLSAGPRLMDPEQLATLPFDALRPGQLRRLVHTEARRWEELLPFAQALVPDLGAGDSAAAISAGRSRLRAELAALATTVANVGRDLRHLAGSLQRPLPPDVVTALEALEQVAAASGAEAFARRLDDLYEFDLEAWRRALGRFAGWRLLGSQAEALVALHQWQAEVRLPVQHPLEGDQLALRSQFDLGRLTAQPHLARVLLAQAEHFKRQYAEYYRQAHRAHHAELARLAAVAEQLATTSAALGRLNRLASLGPPEPLGAALDAFGPLLEVCRAEPDLSWRAVCPYCRWHADQPAPVAALEELRAGLSAAFQRRSGRLRALLSDEIVAGAGDQRLAALQQVLVLQQAAALPEVLTDETVALLAACLGEVGERLDLSAALADRFEEVGAEQVPAALAALEEVLRAATADGRRVRLS